MSDGAVIAIATGCVTIITTIVGFLTLWIKLKYGVDKAEEASAKVSAKVSVVEDKVDQNTTITTEAKEAASGMSAHADACNAEIARLSRGYDDHGARILALETQVAALKTSIESVDKNVASSRHEMRGHLQVVMNKLDIMSVKSSNPTAQENK